jgi:hypothetical protein
MFENWRGDFDAVVEGEFFDDAPHFYSGIFSCSLVFSPVRAELCRDL